MKIYKSIKCLTCGINSVWLVEDSQHIETKENYYIGIEEFLKSHKGHIIELIESEVPL